VIIKIIIKKNQDIKFNAHDAFLDEISLTVGKIKVKRLQRQIISTYLEAS
jgi:hypothetical protein